MAFTSSVARLQVMARFSTNAAWSVTTCATRGWRGTWQLFSAARIPDWR